MEIRDLAYVAAVIDNVGSLRLREYGPSLLPIVEVSGRIGSMEWLAGLTGTKVVQTKRDYKRHNCSAHCPEPHAHIVSVSGRWHITGMRATIVLYNVEPFMRVQSADARRLIDAGMQVGYKGQVVNDMTRLGWTLPDLRVQPRARVSVTPP